MQTIVLSFEQSKNIVSALNNDHVELLLNAISAVAVDRTIPEDGWPEWIFHRNGKEISILFAATSAQAWVCIKDLIKRAFKPDALSGLSKEHRTFRMVDFEGSFALLHTELRIRTRNCELNGLSAYLTDLLALIFSSGIDDDPDMTRKKWIGRSSALDPIVSKALSAVSAQNESKEIDDLLKAAPPAGRKNTL